MDQLYYEVMHNLVVETTRMAIEVKNLKMKVESLTSRLEFNERRARALESVVVYKPSEGPGATGSPHTTSLVTSAAETSPNVGDQVSPVAGPTPTAEGPGQRSRRRRRRRGRRGGGSASAIMAETSAAAITPESSGVAEDVPGADDAGDEPEFVESGSEADQPEPNDRPADGDPEPQ